MNSVQSLDGVLDVLVAVEEYLDNHADVLDGDYGEVRPNDAMRLLSSVQDAIEVIERFNRRLVVESVNVVRIANGLTPID